MTANYYMINRRLTRPHVYEGQAVAQIRIQKQANRGQTFFVCDHEQRILNVRPYILHTFRPHGLHILDILPKVMKKEAYLQNRHKHNI
jgi:hypothetical protein